MNKVEQTQHIINKIVVMNNALGSPCSRLLFSTVEHAIRHSCNSGEGTRPAGARSPAPSFLACHHRLSSLLIIWKIKINRCIHQLHKGIRFQNLVIVLPEEYLQFWMRFRLGHKGWCRLRAGHSRIAPGHKSAPLDTQTQTNTSQRNREPERHD